ncbi:hypothetical protein [Paenibacillus polygoni]|uniref:hypothetical protein n=1 Tax=Paenibacillus polygoni TaxID=3050112 RepID=UPI00387F8396
MPFWDDLYLDVIVLPNGKYLIKDIDELEDALNTNVIEQADYLLAKNTMKDLMKNLHSMSLSFMKSSQEHLHLLLKAHEKHSS